MTATKQDEIHALLSALFDCLCHRPWEFPTVLVGTPKLASAEIQRLNGRCDKLADEVDRLQWALRSFMDYCEGQEDRTLQFIYGSAEQILKASQERMEEV